MGEIDNSAKDWYAKLLPWQKKAPEIAYSSADVSESDKMFVFKYFLKDAGITAESLPEPGQIEFDVFSAKSEKPFFIETLSDVKGIAAIEATNPVTFHKKLSVIYGENGSGKSSYIRLLKNMCGSKGSSPLKGNIFTASVIPQSAKVKLSSDAQPTEIVWTPSAGVHNELKKIKIYDSDNAVIYANSDSDTVYEPVLIKMLVECKLKRKFGNQTEPF